MKKFFPVFFVFAICFSLIVSCSKEPTDPIDRSFSNAGFTKIDAGDAAVAPAVEDFHAAGVGDGLQ